MENDRRHGIKDGNEDAAGPSSSSSLSYPIHGCPVQTNAPSLFPQQPMGLPGHPSLYAPGDAFDFPHLNFDPAPTGDFGEAMLTDAAMAVMSTDQMMHHEPIGAMPPAPMLREVKQEPVSSLDAFFSPHPYTTPLPPAVRNLSMVNNVDMMEEPFGEGPSTSMGRGSLTGMLLNKLKSAVTKPTSANQQIFPKKEDIAINSRIPLPAEQTPAFWCSFFYYELSERVGEPYRCERFSLRPRHLLPANFRPPLDEVHIDGLCAPMDGKRFCLGILSNATRNPVVLATRRQIGKGCRLYVVGDDIYLQCLSGSPIFVQSPMYAFANKDNLATVYRLPPGLTIKLFECHLFDQLLEQALPNGYNAVYGMQPMCQARISFVKGWGENYRRQHITATPCWVEAQFALPLQVLDKALHSVAAPNDDDIHSFT